MNEESKKEFIEFMRRHLTSATTTPATAATPELVVTRYLAPKQAAAGTKGGSVRKARREARRRKNIKLHGK